MGKSAREITYRKVSPESFAVFGTCANMVKPSGPKLGAEPVEFYRDMVLSHLGATQVASFSICRVVRRPFVIDVSEYHDSCCEIVLPLDGDVIMHVAPAGPEKEFPLDSAQAFLVPRGHGVLPAAGGLAPRAVRLRSRGREPPHRPAGSGTHMNDCKVWPLPKKSHLKIVGEGIR